MQKHIKTNKSGTDLIKKFESLRMHQIHLLIRGDSTIGYGLLVKCFLPNENLEEITEEKAHT
ncbi:MAG: hypothetical protein AB8U26_00990 [Rickettsiales endosymbiont of Dermacentor nuttalli]